MDGPRLLGLRGLRVAAPGGRVLVEGLDLELAPGEIAVLLGASGAGKSTLARFLLEPEALAADGFVAHADELHVASAELGLVPQRGALFDHLDVGENIGLALRYGRGERPGGLIEAPGAAPDQAEGLDAPAEIARWLAAVGLDPALARQGVEVASLSGGQAQRVAVARVLAGGRRLLVLDEPSVGLDAERVRALARLLLERCAEDAVAALVITHDLALAGGVASQLVFLDPVARRASRLFEGSWPGPLEAPANAAQRGEWLIRLEDEVVTRLTPRKASPPVAIAVTVADDVPLPVPVSVQAPPTSPLVARVELAPGPTGPVALSGRPGQFPAWSRRVRALALAAEALASAPTQLARQPRDFAQVAGRVLVQALVRPLAFYAVVSTLIGYTVLFVMSRIGGAGVRPDYLLRQIGGAAVTTLAPPLAAILFVAASGGAVAAWLGGMGLTRQLAALNALGVPVRRYLLAPTWLALGIASLATSLVFAGGMLLGGYLLCRQLGVGGAWELLTADLLDPRPARVRHVVRAAALAWVYAWGAASGVVAEGLAPMRSADDVTRAMTRGVVVGTLWVVAWELASALLVFR